MMTDPTANITTLLSYWRDYLPYMKTMDFNTFRLAFDFRTGNAISLDYEKMDAVVNFLGQNGIQSILDAHTYDLTDPSLLSNWQTMAVRYSNNQYVAAFEINNEPHLASQTAMMNAQAYYAVTIAIRQIDPSRTCIWQAPPYYIPDFSRIQNLLLPNVVYSVHEWWTNSAALTPDNIESTSQGIIDRMLTWQTQYNVSIWLGEYGGPPGGNVVSYNVTDSRISPGGATYGLQWQICRQLTIDCNNNNIGWNLWCGVLYPVSTKNRLVSYVDMMATIPPNPQWFDVSLVLVGGLGVGLLYFTLKKVKQRKARS